MLSNLKHAFKPKVLTCQLVLALSLVSGCGESTNRQGQQYTQKLTQLTFRPAGSFAHGGFDQSAAEITAFHTKNKHGIVANAHKNQIDIINLSNINSPKLFKSIPMSLFGAKVNSVAVHGDIVAVAVESSTKTNNGSVVILNAKSNYELVGYKKVGALPDMLTFTPDGKKVIVANEGEPNDDYSIDPEGSISIVDVSNLNNLSVKTVNFRALNSFEPQLKSIGVRITGKNATVAQDLEPEYISVSADSRVAYVSLQENNAIAYIDINGGKVLDVKALGYKDHSKPGNELDISDKDNMANITTWPVLGLYQPDGIATFSSNGRNYLVTANEGDGREYIYKDNRGNKFLAFTDETKVGRITLDAKAFANKCGSVLCNDDRAMGRLKMVSRMGDENGDGLYEKVYSFGARSFSIWDTANMSKPVYDSGSDFAKLVRQQHPRNFNASNDNNAFDNRSDNKGAEPEGVVLGNINGETVAFIALEKISGIVAYNISNPRKPKLIGYINTRTFNDTKMQLARDGLAPANNDGDLGPEGMTFIPAKQSPSGKPLLYVGYEVSGTSRVFELIVS